jgi:hypothetical protein
MNKHLARNIAFDTVQYAYRRTNWPVKVPPLLRQDEHSAPDLSGQLRAVEIQAIALGKAREGGN